MRRGCWLVPERHVSTKCKAGLQRNPRSFGSPAVSDAIQEIRGFPSTPHGVFSFIGSAVCYTTLGILCLSPPLRLPRTLRDRPLFFGVQHSAVSIQLSAITNQPTVSNQHETWNDGHDLPSASNTTHRDGHPPQIEKPSPAKTGEGIAFLLQAGA